MGKVAIYDFSKKLHQKKKKREKINLWPQSDSTALHSLTVPRVSITNVGRGTDLETQTVIKAK